MAGTIAHIVKCPICQSNGEIIHRDVRASLVYSCRNCSHEWQIDPTDEPVRRGPGRGRTGANAVGGHPNGLVNGDVPSSRSFPSRES